MCHHFYFHEFVKSKNLPCVVGQIRGTTLSISPGKGTDRDRHETCGGMRWTQARRRRRALVLRTAKSCGPGAATVASIHAGPCWRVNGDKKRRSPGRARISRKAIARGKSGCLGCTCLIRVRFLLPLHTVPRAQSAPGFPCALSSERDNDLAKLRRNRAVRMIARVSMLLTHPAIRNDRCAKARAPLLVGPTFVPT